MSAYEARRDRKSLSMSDEAGRDRCTALWKTFSVKCATEEEEETESEEGRKRGSAGAIRQTCPGHVARVRVRGETTAPPAKGCQEHLGAFRGITKPLETGKVLGEGSKTYLIYVLRASILIQSVWFLHHHGGGRVESLVKK